MVVDELRPLNSSSSNRVPLKHYSSSEDPRKSLWSRQSPSLPPGGRNKSPDSSIWRYINGLLGRGESSRQEAKKRCEAIASRHSSSNIENSLRLVTKSDLPTEHVRRARQTVEYHSNNNRRFYRRTTMDLVDHQSHQLVKAQARVSRSLSLRTPTQNQTLLHRTKVGNSLRGIRSGFKSCKISGEATGEHLYRRSSEILRDSRRRFGSVFAALLIVATLFEPYLLLLSPSVEAASIPIRVPNELKDLQPPLSVNEGGVSISEASSVVDELPSLEDSANQAAWYVANSQQRVSPLLIYDPNEDSKNPLVVAESDIDYNDNEYNIESTLPVSSDSASGGLERNKRDLVWLERRRLDRNRASEPPPWQKVLPERRDGYSTPSSTISKQVETDTRQESGQTTVVAQSRRSQRESAGDLYNALMSDLLEGAFSNPELLDGVYNEIEQKLKSDDGSTSSDSLSFSGVGGGKNKSQKLEQLQQHLARLVKWPLTLDGSDARPGETEESLAKELDEEPEATLKVVGDELMSSVDEEKLVPVLDDATNGLRGSFNQDQQQPQSATYLEMDDTFAPTEGSASEGISDALDMAQLLEGQSGRKLQLEPGLMLPSSDSQTATSGNINMFPTGMLDSQTPALLAVEPHFHVLEDIDQEDGGQLHNQQLPNEISGDSQQATGAQQLLNQWGPDSAILQYDVSKRTLWPGWLTTTTSSRAADPRLSFQLAPRANNMNRAFKQQQHQPATGELMDQLALLLIESGYLNRSKLVAIGTKLKQYLEAVFGMPSDSIVGLYPISQQELLMKIDRVKVAMSSNHWSAAKPATNYDPAAPLFVIAAWPKGNKQNPIPLLSGILRTLELGRDQSLQLQLHDAYGGLSIQQRDPILAVPIAPSQYIQHPKPTHKDDSTSSKLTALAAYLESVFSNTESVLNTSSSSTTDLFGWKISTILVVVLLALPSVLVICTILVWLWCKRHSESGHTSWTLKRSLNGSFRYLWPRSFINNKSAPESSDPLTSWNSEDSGLTGSCQPSVETKEGACRVQNRRLDGPSKALGPAHQLAHRLNGLLRGIKRGTAPNPVDNDDGAGIYYNEDIESRDAESTERLLSESASKSGEVRPPPVAASGFKFRTSQSYIRSLIEALSRAGNSEAGGSSTANESPPQDLEEIVNDEQSTGVGAGVVAQMDISAAHLILDYMERHLEDKEALKKEWIDMRASSHSKLNQVALERQARVALLAKNKHKNVSSSVVPFDRNRIKLGWSRGEPTNVGLQNLDTNQLESYDYINASFIYDDNLRKPTHIIAQGPLEKTSGQFWQMVWEQNVSTIVMLTRLSEAGIRMCHCYWPSTVSASVATTSDGSQVPNSQQERRMSVTSVYTGNQNGAKSASISVSNGDLNNNVLKFQLDMAESGSEDMVANRIRRTLEVHLVSEHVSSSDYIVRNMYLVDQSTGETRNVTQFHYLQWPHDAIPSNVKSFLEFRRKVHKSYRNLSSPILVHDSNGGARSGTYTLIDIILERIRNGAKEIDPRATLEHLADQRAGLFPSQSQFEFVLLALAEEIQIILQALPQ